MNPTAAQELLDLIMLDEFVERRRKLDDWVKRWIATMHVEFTHDGTCSKEQVPELLRRAKGVLVKEIFKALTKDEVHALLWGRLVEDPNSLACEMHVVLQVPREKADLSAVEEATKRMLDIARGGGK